MPFLKPYGPHLKGVKLTTLAAKQRGLTFAEPFLSAKGDRTREAKEIFLAYQEKKTRFEALKEKQEPDELEQAEINDLKQEISWNAERRLVMDWMIASLQQQYQLKWDNDEIKKIESLNGGKFDPTAFSDKEIEDFWHETFCEYFTEDDLERFQFCMQMGKEYTKSEMLEWIGKNREFFIEKK